MRTPALAMAWELWGKNRAGILISFASLAMLGVAIVASALVAGSSAIKEDMIPASAVAFMVFYLYLVAIFTHPEFQFLKAYAGFPSRKFSLPVRTSALVAWHMLYGLVGLVVLWLAFYLLVWLPAGIEPAWWLLPLLGVSLVWMQAICWAIPRPPLLQVIAVCVVFPLLKFSLELVRNFAVDAFNLGESFENSLTATRVLTVLLFSAPALVAGYLFAFVGVLRVRHGGTLLRFSWQHKVQLLAEGRPAWERKLASPTAIQLWYELRRKAILFLPLFALAYLAFISMVATPFVTPTVVIYHIALLVALLFLVAFCVGYGLGKPYFWGNLGFTSWDAARPVSSGFMAVAKMRAAAVTSLATWLMLFLLLPVWMSLWGANSPSIADYRFFLPGVSLIQLYALVAVAFLALFAITWSQMIGGYCLSVTGREWIVNGAGLLSFSLVAAFLLSWRFIALHEESANAIWTFWICTAALLVALKLAGAAYFLQVVCRRQLVRFRELTPSLCLWGLGLVSLLVFLHSCLSALIISGDEGVPRIPSLLLSLLAILAMPLMRLTAAPAAVALGRHR